MSPSPISLPQVADGFMYTTSLDYLPGWYNVQALGTMAFLRRAANLRGRLFAVPDAGSISTATPILIQIPPYQSFRQEVNITPKSWIWGFALLMPQYAPSRMVGGPPNPYDCAVKVTEVSTGIPLFEEAVSGTAAAPGSINSGLYANYGGIPMCLLTEPRAIGEPGKVIVELFNITSSSSNPNSINGTIAISPQLILAVAEPCRTFEQWIPPQPQSVAR